MTTPKAKLAGLALIAVLCAGFMLSLLLIACEGAEEREAAYLEHGKELFDEGEYAKARLEFKNARQINPLGIEALYYLGRIDEKQGDWRRAFVAFSTVAQQDSKHVGARVWLGKIYLLAGDLEQAVVNADSVIVREPQYADAHALRGAVYLRRDQLSDAKTEAEEALSLDPGNINAVSVLAGTYRKLTKHAEAIEVLQNGIELHPQSTSLRLFKIALHLEKNETAEIETLFRELFRLDPKNAGYRISLARLYISWDRRDDAEKLLRDAIAAAPEDDESKLLLVDFLANKRGFEVAERELTGFVNQWPENFVFRFGLADLYTKNEFREQAEAIFREIVELSREGPEALTARTALARMALVKKNLAAVEELIEAVFSKDATNGEALIIRARLLLHKGSHQKAIADLRTVLRNYPTSLQAHRLLTRAHLQGGEVELATESLDTLVRLDPLNHSARVQLAQLLTRQKNFDKALAHLEQVLRRAPENPDALTVKAKVLLVKRRFAEAAVTARRLTEKPEREGTGYQVLGRARLAQSRNAEAAAAFKKALALAPGDMRSLRGLVRALVTQGQAEQAVSYLKIHIEATPDNAFAHNLLGEVYAAGKQPELAERAFLMASATTKEWPVPYMNLGKLRVRVGDLKGAVEILQRGVEHAPENQELQFGLANAYRLAGNIVAAMETYRAMLARDPRLDVAANNLAALIADHEYDDPVKLDEALELARRFAASNNSRFLDTLGWVHYRRGDLAQAVIFLARAVSSGPDFAQLRYHLGVVYHGSNQPDSARAELEKAVVDGAKYPELEKARTLLATLK